MNKREWIKEKETRYTTRRSRRTIKYSVIVYIKSKMTKKYTDKNKKTRTIKILII